MIKVRSHQKLPYSYTYSYTQIGAYLRLSNTITPVHLV